MSIFGTLKRLHKPEREDVNSLKELASTTKWIIRATCIVEAVALLFLVAALIWLTTTCVNYNQLDKTIRKEYSEYVDTKVYIVVDIETANITDYGGILATTDKGNVICEEKPKQNTLLIYKDLEGDLRPIESLNASNRENYKTFEYVSSEYTPIDGGKLLQGETDRITYKGYIKHATELNELGSTRTFKTVVTIIIGVVNAIIAAMLGVLISGHKKMNLQTFDSKETLKSDGTKAKKENKIKKSGIGADGKMVENYERTAEDAIAAEGGAFTGTTKSAEESKDKADSEKK